MNRIHPKTHQAFALVMLLSLTGTSGCQSQPTGFSNPFLAPDRVPPPATRTLLPGQAAPYYPGDPLPTMRSGNNRGPATPAVAANPAAQRAATPAPRNPNPQPASRPSQVAANESPISIPRDNEPLRFALPKPAATVASNTPQPGQLAAAPSPQTVAEASYNPPLLANPTAQNPSQPSPTGPWRSPQVARQNAAAPLMPTPTQTLSPAASPVVAAATPLQLGPPPTAPIVAAPAPQSMAVRLRAVPSPPLETADLNTPRIRLPGYPAPQQVVSAPPGSVQQAAYYASNVVPSAGTTQSPVMQTVQITPIAANMYSPTVASVGSSDGFRPRGSMR